MIKHDESDLSIETDNDALQRRLALHLKAFHGEPATTIYSEDYFTLKKKHKKAHSA